jgi:hypothetical protein
MRIKTMRMKMREGVDEDIRLEKGVWKDVQD